MAKLTKKPLSVVKVLTDSVTGITANARPLFRTLAIPSLALAASDALRTQTSLNSWIETGLIPVHLALYAIFAVTCHRTLLLGAGSIPNKFGIYWSRREFAYAGWTIALFLLTIPVIFLPIGIFIVIVDELNALDYALLVLISWPGIYVFARTSLMLPGIAIDRPRSFGDAWQLSSSNGLQVTIAIALPTIALWALGDVYLEFVGEEQMTWSSFSSSFFLYLLGAIEVTVVTSAYKFLAKEANMQNIESPR